MFNPLADLDGAFRDIPFLDPEFPPSGHPVLATCGGTEIYGELLLAPGRGAKGTVIISAAMGGGDNMESLSLPLLTAGIHVLTYRPRGTSGEGVPFSWPGTVDDLHALVDWIATNAGEGKVDLGGVPLRLDPGRIALFGFSGGGGNVSFAACAESRLADYAIALAAANLEVQLAPDKLAAARPMLAILKEMSGGEVDEAAWVDALTEADLTRLSIIQQAPKLVDKHLLMIGASHDETSPPEIAHTQIVRALQEAGLRDLTEVILDTDHMFLTKRYALARLVISWLRDKGF